TVVKDIVDFSNGGAYSIYNWELFFHAPLMIACRLSQNQRFEEAMSWFHYIFNPTDIEDLPTPQRYWVTKPFFEYNSDDYRKQRIQNILSNINLPEYQEQLKAWRNNPFKPHLIARTRPVAYQRNVVMKYIDNLIAWGDQLFRRDTIESINEASLLYMLAYEILGRRPEKVPNVEHEDLTFNELETKLDSFGNARVDVIIEDTLLPIEVVPSTDGSEPMPKLETFYFGIPNNDYLFKYWDTVEDRLFKIRNCMNIEGIVRQLPLFEPPIDPALLVKAAAAGIDLSSVLDDISASTPHVRFRIVVQKAIEFCNEVKELGDKMLGVLERRDAEGLSLLRSQQEIQMLEAVKEIKKKQIDEVVETI
ncbi:MAG: toxin, partial [Mycobacterium sp.]|nr:toxin [Mycobacterium sp.]